MLQTFSIFGKSLSEFYFEFQEILDKVDQFTAACLNADSAVVAVLTHGEEGGIVFGKTSVF